MSTPVPTNLKSTLPAWQEFARMVDNIALQDIVEVQAFPPHHRGLAWQREDRHRIVRFKLDYWKHNVQTYTDKMLPQFRRKRYQYENSEAYFRILCLITVLQRDMGVHYNPDRYPRMLL